MKTFKIFLAALIVTVAVSCKTELTTESLAGNWKVTSAVGNNNRHWTGTFTLSSEGGNKYKGFIHWDSTDGAQVGTDNVEGTFDLNGKLLTMHSVSVTGNIEVVTYTMKISGSGRIMTGIWTGSSDGTIDKPGKWSAVKQF